MRNQNHFVSECQFQASNRPCFGVTNNCSTTYLGVITYIITMAHYNYFVGILQQYVYFGQEPWSSG